jgi:hippurate hydrolase
MPGIEKGHIGLRHGPTLAASDRWVAIFKGSGGHGSMPHQGTDPTMPAAQFTMALQTIVSRNHKATNQLVISVTQIHTGTTDNVIPETAYINGTVRTFEKDVQAMVVKRMRQIVAGHAASFGVTAELDFVYGYPPTINDVAKTGFAASVAADVAGEANVDTDFEPVMGAEDFSYMLEARPGAYLMLGQGEGVGVHHPKYNFNDEIAPVGASFFARLVERAQPLAGA